MSDGCRDILLGKSPKDVAKVVGAVDRYNYLAHTIREIQSIIFKMYRKHYIINTYLKDVTRHTTIFFYEDHGCDIYLSYECKTINEKDVRLKLAHELGHLVAKIDKLEELSGVAEYSEDEEVFAWVFAYHLVLEKSEMHRSDIERKKHIFTPDQLKRALTQIMKNLSLDNGHGNVSDDVCKRVLKELEL